MASRRYLAFVAILVTACGAASSERPLPDAVATWCVTAEAALPLDAAMHALWPELDPKFQRALNETLENLEIGSTLDSTYRIYARTFLDTLDNANLQGESEPIHIGGGESFTVGMEPEDARHQYNRLCSAAFDATH